MSNKISYKRYLNNNFLNGKSDDKFLDEILGDKGHFWSTTGRNGLMTLFKALKLQRGDKVLLPAFVAHGVVLPIKRMGLDIEYYHSDTKLAPDYLDIQEKIKDEKVKVIFVIHYFGFPQDVDLIFDLAAKNDVFSIEDCAQAFYSSYSDRRIIGQKGDIALYSLTKFLAIPDGSLFVFNNEKLKYLIHDVNFKNSLISKLSVLLARCQLKLSYWQVNSKIQPLNLVMALIYKIITPFHYWLICLEKKPVTISNYSFSLLKSMDLTSLIEKRKANMSYVEKALLKSKFLTYRKYLDSYCLTGYPVLSTDREHIIKKLSENGIKCLVYNKFWWFIPPFKIGEFQPEREFFQNHFLLPINENLDRDQLDHIVNSFNGILPAK